MNLFLSAATAAGGESDVAVAGDRGNAQWWDRYMSLADGPAPSGPLTSPAPHDPGPLPTDDALVAGLAEPYPLTDAQVAHLRAESFVKLPGVLSPGGLERLRARLREMLDAAVDPAVGFRSLEMMWRDDPLLRAAVLSPG